MEISILFPFTDMPFTLYLHEEEAEMQDFFGNEIQEFREPHHAKPNIIMIYHNDISVSDFF